MKGAKMGMGPVKPIPLTVIGQPGNMAKKKTGKRAGTPKPGQMKVKLAGPPAKVQETLGGFRGKR